MEGHSKHDSLSSFLDNLPSEEAERFASLLERPGWEVWVNSQRAYEATVTEEAIAAETPIDTFESKVKVRTARRIRELVGDILNRVERKDDGERTGSTGQQSEPGPTKRERGRFPGGEPPSEPGTKTSGHDP